jgi:hypothetical protein
MRVLSTLGARQLLIVLLLLGIAVAIYLIRKSVRKLGKDLLGSTWGAYLKGQGLLLFMIMVAGAALAGGAAYVGNTSTAIRGVELKEFNKIDPSDHPVFEEIDVEQYSHVTLLARTAAPENGSATVAIFSDKNGVSAGRYEVKRLDCVSNSWSRWDQEYPGKHLNLVISAPSEAGAAPATEVEIRVYVSPR